MNPNLPEAICGLCNSLCSICDWRGRGAIAREVGVDEVGHSIPPAPHCQQGWITKMVAVTDEQITQGYLRGLDDLSLASVTEECMRALACAMDRPLSPTEVSMWHARFQQLAGTPEDHEQRRVNTTGFIIRFIDWIMPRLQRRWYIKTFGKAAAVDRVVPPSDESLNNVFVRPALPKTLQSPPMPSVLPFHTVSHGGRWSYGALG